MNSNIIFYSSGTVGAIAIISVAYVFIRQYSFKAPGFGLLLSGTVLIGLPVWSSAKLSWNKEGFNMEFETLKQAISALDTKTAANNLALSLIGGEVKTLGKASQKAEGDLLAISSDVSKIRATSNLSLTTRLLPTVAGSLDLATQLGPEFTTGVIKSPKLDSIVSESLMNAIQNTETIMDKVQKAVPLDSNSEKREPK